MDILPGAEALNHLLIPRHVGQEAELNLGVIRIHQNPSRPGNEHLPNLRPQLGAHRDVLEVGFRGGQPSGGGDGVLKAGVNPPVPGNDLGQPFHIGGVELGQLAVLQNQVDNGVMGAEFLQHLGAGGVPCLGLFHRGQAQLLKENPAQLLGGVQIKFLPRLGPNLLLEGGNAGGEPRPKLGQGLLVHQHPRLLHLRQHRTQGELNVLIHLRQSKRRQLLRKQRIQGKQQGGMAGHDLPGRLGPRRVLPDLRPQIFLGRG